MLNYLRITECENVEHEKYYLCEELDKDGNNYASFKNFPKEESITKQIERLRPRKEQEIRLFTYVDNKPYSINFDELDNLKQLSSALINKKMNKCSYIKRITQEQRYTHKEITIIYNNGVKQVYQVNAHF